MRRAILAGFAGLVMSLAAAAAADDAVPPAQRGHELYQQRCGACHDENGFGTRVLARRAPEGQAMLEKRKTLPAAYVTMVVRRGLGSMPQIREAELSDAELALIASHLEGSE